MADSPLISVQELNDILGQDKLIVLDVRSKLGDDDYGKAVYAQSHIPSARRADMHDDVTGCCSGTNGRHPLPDSGRFCVNMRRLGVSPDNAIVVYDDGDMSFAARLWFTLRWVGFANVRVLDGGFKAWEKAGLETTDEVPTFEQGTYRATTPLARVFDDDFVEANLKTKEYTLIDARSAERFRGEVEPIDPEAGHIPGSLNRHSVLNFTEEGVLKAPDVLAQEFKALIGETPADKIIHSCGSGVSACCNLLAMIVAGMPPAGLYVGSWSEWIADADRPRAKGPAA
ncbi:MAG: sulfurtransferase [Sutterellaceae bacterium]|nr:sulfurtransferase [Sutterellaceae bacterium]